MNKKFFLLGLCVFTAHAMSNPVEPEPFTDCCVTDAYGEYCQECPENYTCCNFPFFKIEPPIPGHPGFPGSVFSHFIATCCAPGDSCMGGRTLTHLDPTEPFFVYCATPA